MIRNSIVAKLWLTIVGMVILVLALLAILLIQFFDSYVYRQQTQDLTRLAVAVERTAVAGRLVSSSHEIGTGRNSFAPARLLIGNPIAGNPETESVYHNFTAGQRATFMAGRPTLLRQTHSSSQALIVAMMIPNRPSPGMVVVSQPLSALDEPISWIRDIIVFAVVFGAVLTTGLAFVVSKNLSRPLVQMNKVAEAMASGNFGGQIVVGTNDEVGRLGRTFNTLAAQLAKTIEALSVEKEQLSSILSSLEDGVVAVDLAGTVTLQNPPGSRRLRYARLAETGDPDADRLPTTLQDMVVLSPDHREPTVREATWRGRQMLITAIPLFESDGERLRGTVFVLRDVTEERRLDRLRKDFIANVSHELRTPLSMLQGYSEALLDDFGEDPEQQHDLVEIIHDETLRMRRLVNDLLDFAQLQSARFQMHLAETDLGTLVRRVGRKFANYALESSVNLTVSVPESSVVTLSDVDRLEQVLTNLLDNALRHTPPEGCVEVVLSTTRRDAQILVSDNGSGISEEDLPYIWERFYKGDKARTRGRSGTGLGLAIARHIVLEHGGDIMVESKVGVGTRFTINIPITLNQ